MDRESSLLLLRKSHDFPGPFEFRVVVRPEAISTVVSAMAAAGSSSESVVSLSQRPSRKGTYVALRVRMQLESAEEVLDVYGILQQLDGVVTTM